MQNKGLDKNILLYYFYKMFSEPVMAGPIIMLYLLSKGLSFTQIMILQVIFSIAVILLEIPTGSISDLIKRKYVLAISRLFLAFGFLLLTLASSFYVFIISEILVAIAISLNSGTDTALTYDYLLANKKESEFAKVQGHAFFLLGVTTAIACLLSGFLFEINKDIPIIISVIWTLISSVLIIFFKEINTSKEGTRKTYKEFLNNISAGFKYAKNNQRVRTIVLFTIFLTFFFGVTFWFYPPYMEEINLSVRYFGIVFAGMNLIWALSSKYAHIYIQKTKGYTLISLSWILSIGFIFSSMLRNFLGMFSFTGEQTIRGIQPIAVNKYINKHIPTNMRATIISYNSLIAMISTSISKLFFGYTMDRFSVFDVRLAFGLVMLTGTLFLSKFLTQNLKTTKIRKENISLEAP